MTKDWTGNSNSIYKTLGASNHTDKERQKYTGIQRQIAYYTNDGWCYQYGELMYDDDMEGVTHWMPLPSSPNCL